LAEGYENPTLPHGKLVVVGKSRATRNPQWRNQKAKSETQIDKKQEVVQHHV